MPKKAADWRNKGEPHINGVRARPFATWCTCWQDRVRKERLRCQPDGFLETMVAKTRLQVTLSPPKSTLPGLEDLAFGELEECARQEPAAIAAWKRAKSVGGFPTERYPVGVYNCKQNASSPDLMKTFGPRSWEASGGFSTTQREMVGRASLTKSLAMSRTR
eukprot:TRINITY_DN7604_c0_g4_i1.p2 TRINITY_DN7604_c0_g4~~TRINITY_DN7604_c0_g4_i1.p2  ORF type:complete len:162 (+),score=29.19 TRINITY_DN7604_c0_g4_i1:79-564(+)